MTPPARLLASTFVNRPTGTATDQGARHILSGARHTLCGREATAVEDAPSYASCRSCLKSAGIAAPEPITLDEFLALAREVGLDMADFSWAITADMLDDDGMPHIHYPDGRTYELLLAALARVI